MSDEERLQLSPSHMESSQTHEELQSHATSSEGIPETLSRIHHSSEVQAKTLQHHQTAEPLQEDHCHPESEGDENRTSEEAGSRATSKGGGREAETRNGRGGS